MKIKESATKKRKMQLTKSLASLVRPGNQIKAAMRFFFVQLEKTQTHSFSMVYRYSQQIVNIGYLG